MTTEKFLLDRAEQTKTLGETNEVNSVAGFHDAPRSVQKALVSHTHEVRRTFAYMGRGYAVLCMETTRPEVPEEWKDLILGRAMQMWETHPEKLDAWHEQTKGAKSKKARSVHEATGIILAERCGERGKAPEWYEAA